MTSRAILNGWPLAAGRPLGTPAPTPLPSFTTNPSISPTSGNVGATFTASDGVIANGIFASRRWLLSGLAIGTGTTVVPNADGSLVLEVTATRADGSGAVVVPSGAVTVSAAAATLNALTLDSTTATQNTVKTINILGATNGSTITANQLPAGMTLDSAARTISGTPTVAATTAITLTETLAGATNSPRVSNTSVIVAAAGSTIDPANYLDSSEMTMRQTVLDEHALGWQPDISSIAWDDTVTATSSSQLNGWLSGTAIGGVTRNSARNQRVLLDPAGDFSAASQAIMQARGLDYLANGKTLLIDGQTAIIRSSFTISGCRGLFVRGGGWTATVTDAGGDAQWTPAANTVSVTNGGAGFQAGQSVTLTSANSSITEIPTLIVGTVDGNGAILTASAGPGLQGGVMTGTVTGVSGSSATSTANATFTLIPGGNPRDNAIFIIQRTGSFPLLPVVILAEMNIGSGFTSNSPGEWRVGVGAVNCEQVYLRDINFDGCQTAISTGSVRRLKRENCDFQRLIGDARISTNTSGNNAVGSGQTYNQAFPDGFVHTWDRLTSIRAAYDDCAATNLSGRRWGFYNEHTDGGQEGTGGDTGGHKVYKEHEAIYLERETFFDSTKNQVRYGGGTQGDYSDDSSFAIDKVEFNCGFFCTAVAASTAWNGTTRQAYCTSGRTGAVTPSGGSGWTTNYDSGPGLLARQKSTYSGSQAFARRSVAGQFTGVSGSGYTAVTPTLTNCVVADPRVAGDYAAKFTGATFGTDAQGRTSYIFTDDGTDTRAQFRARLYARFVRASEGFLDPSNLPASAGTPPARLPLPGTPAPSAAIVLPADVWAFGSSSMQGGQSFANASQATSTEDALTQVVRAVENLPDGDTSYTTVSGSKTHTSPPVEYNLTGANASRKIRNHGVSGQTSGSSGTIASNMAGKTDNFGANDFMVLHQGDNGLSAGSPANGVELLAGGYAALRSSAGSRPFVEVVNTQGSYNTNAGTASSEPAGSFFAYLKAASLRAQMDLFPGKVFSFHEVLLNSPSQGANDDTDLNGGVAPRSYYVNDGSHQFDPGYKRQGDTIFKPLIDAWAGGTPFAVPQVIEAVTPASPAAGDVIGSVVAYGTGGSWALDSTNTQTAYAINAAGQVSRVGATPPARDVTWAILKASKSGRFDKVSQRIGIAERAAPGMSKLVEFDGYSIIGMPDTKLTNGAKATLLFRLQSVDASVQQIIMGLLGSTGLSIRTNATGNLDIVWKNSANATVFSKTTTGGLFTTGNTVRWVAVCIDLSNAAAEVTKLVTWTTSGAIPTVDSALAAALTADTTTQHVLKMDAAFVIGNNTHQGSASSTWSKFRMGDLTLWTDFVDFEVLANRQAVCDAAGLPLSAWVGGDGTVDGKTPVIRKKGNAADWRLAREQGSLRPATPGASGQYWGFNYRRRPDGEFGYLTTVP